MKTITTHLLAIAGLGLGIAQANVISLNITDGWAGAPVNLDNRAGANIRGWWEVTDYAGVAKQDTILTALRDNTGAVTTTEATIGAGFGGYYSSGTSGFNTATNQSNDMMANFCDKGTGAATIGFTNLNTSLGGSYDVYIYSARNFPNTGVSKFTINGTDTLFLNNESNTGPFAESGFATEAEAENNLNSGNYVVFRNVTTDTLTIDVEGLLDDVNGGDLAAVNGIQLVAAPLTWVGGGTDNWLDGAEWSGGVVPAVDGTDDAEITTGTAYHNGVSAGSDLYFLYDSQLLLDGGNFEEESSAWLRFEQGGRFHISNSGDLKGNGRLRIWRSPGNVVTSGGSLHFWELGLDDSSSLSIDGGATVAIEGDVSILNNYSTIGVSNASLDMQFLELGNWAGSYSFIDLNDGAMMTLDANTRDPGTEVIALANGAASNASLVSFASGSTASLFIDNISQADVETMIGEGKFGIDRVRYTSTGSYVLVVQDAGILIQAGTPVTGEPSLVVDGFDVNGLNFTGNDLDPGKSYQLVRGTDLVTFPDPIGAPVTGVTSSTFLDDAPPAGKAFYRLEGL